MEENAQNQELNNKINELKSEVDKLNNENKELKDKIFNSVEKPVEKPVDKMSPEERQATFIECINLFGEHIKNNKEFYAKYDRRVNKD